MHIPQTDCQPYISTSQDIHRSSQLLNKEVCSLTQLWTALDSGFEHRLLNSHFPFSTGQVPPMDLCCHHLTEETNLKASCIAATDTGFDSPAGAVALHRNTATPDRFQPAHTCFAAVPPGALPSHSHHHNSLEQQPLGDSSRPSSRLSLTAIMFYGI